MDQDPLKTLTDFLALVNAALAPLQPVFDALDEVARIAEANRPPP